MLRANRAACVGCGQGLLQQFRLCSSMLNSSMPVPISTLRSGWRRCIVGCLRDHQKRAMTAFLKIVLMLHDTGPLERRFQAVTSTQAHGKYWLRLAPRMSMTTDLSALSVAFTLVVAWKLWRPFESRRKDFARNTRHNKTNLYRRHQPPHPQSP